MDDYKFVMKKIFATECIFNDVFSRFYHQLVNQGNVVIKDFFKDAATLSASMIDAVLEAIFQRFEMTDSEQKKFMDKVYKEMESCECFENLNKIDTFHDVKKTIMVLREIVEHSMSLITDEQYKKAEDMQSCVMNKKEGDYQPMFMEMDFTPYPVQIKPVV